MDYISKSIKERISIVQSIGSPNELLILSQSLLEYYLVLAFGLLWNKNKQKLDEEDQEYIYLKMLRPTIGDTINLIRKLDTDKFFRNNKKLSDALDEYPGIRNQGIGHGYTYSDGAEEVSKQLEAICKVFQDSKVPFYSGNIDFVLVQSKDNLIFKGLNFRSDGTVISWKYPINSACDLETGYLYALFEDNQYLRVSPFIEIDDFGAQLYTYQSIEEKLIGRIKYNRLLSTGDKRKDWEEIARLCIINDGSKVKTSNGTILNVFDRNYTTFIGGEEIKTKIISFLTKNKSSVCATIWGHGGVGKTATVQSVCDDLANNDKKVFDYILFLSAKDRYYNTYTGNIEQLSDSISTYQQLISKINYLVFGEQSEDAKRIIEYDGRILLIIDDFETFLKEDRESIEAFIQELNTEHHKVLITTRATSINIGLQFPSNELAEKEAVEFLKHLLESKQLATPSSVAQDFSDPLVSEQFYRITGGRPLFIYQFAYILAQRGIKEALKNNINEQQSAIDFLYGRLYDYLSAKAKDVFVVICLLVDEKNPVNMIEKAQYILNMEGDPDGFQSAVQELEKLKIIRYDFDDEEKRFFEVYSPEILRLMNEYYQKRTPPFKQMCARRREQVSKGKSMDVDHSLLFTANANRLTKNEVEVIDGYRQILNRTSASIDIKLSAVINLTAYLFNGGKVDQALSFFEEYHHLFSNIPSKDTERANYASYIKLWARYNWLSDAEEQRLKAVEVLTTYAQTGFDYSRDYDLELAGLLLQYNSIVLIDAWQDLKERRQFDEISSPEFKVERSKQYRACHNLHKNYGQPFYAEICNHKVFDFKSNVKQSIIAGLFSYTDILVRIKKFTLADEICQYILYNAPYQFHAQFRKKQNWIYQCKQNDKLNV